MVNEDGLVCEPGGKPYSGLASRLHKDEEALPHISYKFRKGKKVDRATGWLEDRTEVYSATYENNNIVAEHYSGPGTKEEFLKQTDEHKISRIFYHPSPPLKGGHLLGTNTQGADILAYLYGGLQVNMKAALFYLPIVYFIGITFGMMMGYFGGMFDLGMQRLIEIFSQVPFLFIIMIISDMVPLHMKGMFLIISLLIMFGWMSMTYQLRTSTMKEKARDYVAAAACLGLPPAVFSSFISCPTWSPFWSLWFRSAFPPSFWLWLPWTIWASAFLTHTPAGGACSMTDWRIFPPAGWLPPPFPPW